jgi:hypothetical protein
MLARQRLTLHLGLFREAQAQINQCDFAPLTAKGIEQMPQNPAEKAQHGQGQPVQKPKKGDNKFAQKQFQDDRFSGGNSAPPGRL